MSDFKMGDIDLSGSSDIDGFLATSGSEMGGVHTQNSILQSIGVPSGTDYDVGQIQVTGSTGLDALFTREPQLVNPAHSRRVAAVTDLQSFVRISAETLVHKSDRDLWALKKDANGGFFIERLFDDNGEPLKG